MTMTYVAFKPAFTTTAERDRFFRRAAEGGSVPIGTAMRHVLGTNVGLWGDRGALREDVAKIMACELATWAKDNDEDPLGLPGETIERNALFLGAFSACAKINVDELDYAIRNKGAEPTTSTAEIERKYLTNSFDAKLYGKLIQVSEEYEEMTARHSAERSTIGRR